MKKEMKIIYCLTLFCVMNIFSAIGQMEPDFESYVDLREQNMKNGNNHSFWTVSLAGGPALFQGEYNGDTKNKDLITPYGKLSVARWFSSVWGVRIQVDGGTLKNTALQLWESNPNGKFYFLDSYLGCITNVMNWGSYKSSDRPLSVYLYGGAGFAWTPSRPDYPAQCSPAGLIGGEFNVRLTDCWSVFLELDGIIVKDNFNSYLGGRKYEGYAGGTIGLTYRFN